DTELCLSLSLALLFMKLASMCWLCCCCHHALVLFRSNTNLNPNPEPSMGRALAHYSLLSWGFPLLMLGVAAAFKYKERDVKITGAQVIAQIVHDLNADSHCWLMEGPAYVWGFLVPAVVLLFAGFYLACQGGGAVKIAAALQVDSRAKNKMVKKRGLQIGLFFKILIVLSTVVFVGAVASAWNIIELWSVYSIAQGIQGLVIAMLVSCNCKVLKLYSAPRSQKSRRGTYHSLKDGEGGRYGVLSVTNPNYEDIPPPAVYQAYSEAVPPSPKLMLVDESDDSFVRMAYCERNFVERCDAVVPSALDCAFSGELSTSLAIDEIPRSPLPASV
ncbi:hypothetical protein pipiens_006841, partial [Culex pipiens pipiens]